jgi:hypothetical protein
MKKIPILLIIAIISLPFLFSEKSKAPQILYANEKKSNYLFGDQVYVRRKPNKGGEALTKLSVGTDVRIIQKTSSKLKIGNITDYWYKIDAGGTMGYLWGGLLATAVVKADLDGDGKQELFLLRYFITGGNTVIQLRVARYGKILAEYKNTLKGDYDLLSAKFFKRTDLKPQGRFVSLRFNFYYEVGGTCMILYTKQKEGIYRALKINVDEGEGGYMCQRTLEFPSQSRPADVLIIKSVCGDVSDCTGESGENPCKYEKSESAYKWNGREFQEIR